MAKKKYRRPPRETPPRDDRYMGMAWMWASMSKDPSTQVGCVIVGSDNTPLGSGYNGPSRKIVDTDIDWVRPNKYPYIRHAERNAIRYARGKTQGSIMYVTGMPCPDCMNEILDAGIYKVIYHPYVPDQSSMLARSDEQVITKDLAQKGNVTLEVFKGNINWMRDWTDHLYSKGVFD